MVDRRRAGAVLAGVTAVVVAVVLAGCGGSADGSGPSPAPPVSGGSGSAGAPLSGAPVSGASGAPVSPSSQVVDWPTYHGTADRAGVSMTMPPAGTPRVRLSLKLDGAVYGSPIVAGGLTVVATENDSVYAFDRSFHQVWKSHLGTPSPAGERPCGNIDPLGITGTPVYDPSTGLVFVSPEFTRPVRHALVALNLRTGATAWQRSIDLPGVQTVAMQQRGALAVTGGRVWVPLGGLDGDCGGYKGRVVGVPLSGSGATVAYTVPTSREAGIWTPPGPSVDASGTLFVAVGNGASGTGDRYDHSDSVLAISTDAALRDSFSPTTWASDNEADKDLGSQGPALVGPWIFQAGKSGTAYVLRRDHLGGIGGQVSSAPLCRSFGGTAVDGDVVYVPCTDGVRAVRIDSTGRMHQLWRAPGSVSGSPVVAGQRVWSLDTDAGVLHALDPATGKSLASVAVGATTRFATEAIAGSDVLVPTQAGLTVVRTA